MKKYIFALLIVSVLNSSIFSQTIRYTPKKNEYVSVSSGFIITSGKMGDITEPGFGLTAEYSMLNLFNSWAFGGVETGVYSLQGKSVSGHAGLIVDRVAIFPVMAICGVNLPVSRSFYIKPSVSFGGAFINIKTKPAEGMNIENGEGGDSFLDADLKSGLDFLYRSKEGYFGIGIKCGVFIEEADTSGYISGSVIFGYRF